MGAVSPPELRGDRDAWKAQAERHEEAARELRILVQGAQALARALPANVGDDAQGTHVEAPGLDVGPRLDLGALRARAAAYAGARATGDWRMAPMAPLKKRATGLQMAPRQRAGIA